MLNIGKCWHTNHIVRDYKKVADWYRKVFAARDVFVDHWLEVEKRWATMLVIGELGVDIMQPTPEGAELPLGRFMSRFGEHYQAVAYFVKSPPIEIYDALSAGGVRCYSFAGSGREAVEKHSMVPVFTHPKDTAGQLEFMPYTEKLPGPLGAEGKWHDPRYQPGWSAAPWREHPLGIEGFRLAITVRDLEKAGRVYEALRAPKLKESEQAGAKRAWYRLGEGTLIELVQPTVTDSAAARDLEKNGELLHSTVFEVRDLAAVASHLEAHGIRIAERYDGRIVADAATCFGAGFDFTTERISP
jgi:hypothetical protein